MELLRAKITSEPALPYLLTDLVDEYSNPLYRFCRSLTYSKEDAEDLFQETFLSVFERLPRLTTSDKPRSLLFSTASYIWKSRKRKYARRKRIAPDAPFEVLEEAVSDGESIEDNLIAQDENRLVRELADALPDKYKIPINLYYSAEMSLPDIAEILHIPVGTVKSRLFKARKIIERGLE